MILIPSGKFLMGSDPQQDPDAEDNEQPQHRLYLPNYYLAKMPVTNAQYRAFVLSTDHRAPDRWTGRTPPRGEGDHPVVYVSWYDALNYCQWLSKVTGRSYSLPSEAEWEKGARGTDGRIYPWGNQWDASRVRVQPWWKRWRLKTTPVEACPAGASPYGLLCMAGNVWEWTRSLLGKYPYPGEAQGQAQREDLTAPADKGRILRGGPIDSPPGFVPCASRRGLSPLNLAENVGFRVVMHP